MPFFRFPKKRNQAHRKSALRWQSHEVQITRKTMKSIRLRVRDTGELALSCPHGITDHEIIRFLDARSGWVEQQLQRVMAANHSKAEQNNARQVSLWGKAFCIEVRPAIKTPFEIDQQNATIFIRTPIQHQQEIALLHQKIWRGALQKYMEQALPLWQDKMGVHTKFSGIRNMKTKWGSCNVTRHRIWLNVQLAQYPRSCAEMVLVHELVHLLEASHNKRFYQLMDHFLPDWRNADQILKTQVMSV